MADTEDIPPEHTVWIIWGALLASILIYGVVLVAVPGERSIAPDTLRLLAPVFALAALGEIGAIFWVRENIFFSRLESGAFDDLEQMLGQYFTTNIMTWALAESIAIFGFILSFLGASFAYFAGFALVAIALHVHLRPDLGGVREAFEASRADRRGAESDSDASADQSW